MPQRALKLACLQNWFAAHGDKIHHRPWKFRFGCNLAYFGKIVAWNEKIDQKLPGFRVVGLGIIILELSDEADLLVQLVPECWPMIAALSRSFFALMVRHETQLIFQSLWYLHPSLLTAKKLAFYRTKVLKNFKIQDSEVQKWVWRSPIHFFRF